MTATTILPNVSTRYSIDTLREEARQLIETGILNRQQSIYTLCKYIPAREWSNLECELERHDYLLRDPIGDLISYDSWEND